MILIWTILIQQIIHTNYMEGLQQQVNTMGIAKKCKICKRALSDRGRPSKSGLCSKCLMDKTKRRK